jgi:hypothetical protein
MDNRLLFSQGTRLGSWLASNDYLNLEEWGWDSDYYKDSSGAWFDSLGNEVNLFECAFHAMEAANERA